MALASRRSLALFGAALLAGAAPDAAHLYQEGDFEAARKAWQLAAQGGDADAAYHLGLIYDLGQGVASDARAAFGWYHLAAEAGVPEAEFNVGIMLDGGRGAPHDVAEAAVWYARAAAHGLQRAEYDLAQLYTAGQGVPRNDIAALAWFAAARGHAPAAPAKLRPATLNASDAKPVPPDIPRQDVSRQDVSRQDGGGPNGRPLELVWTATPEPVPVRYFATVLSLRTGAWTPVFDGETALTSLVVPGATSDGCYAWRVYAVAAGQGAHYAASAWQHLGCSAGG